MIIIIIIAIIIIISKQSDIGNTALSTPQPFACLLAGWEVKKLCFCKAKKCFHTGEDNPNITGEA